MAAESLPGLADLVAALGWTLLDFIWQGALIAAAYGLARAVLAKRAPEWRLAAGHLALAGFVLAPVLSLAGRLGAPMSIQSAAQLPVTPMTVVAGTAPLAASIDLLLPWLVAAWLSGVAMLGARGMLRWVAIRQICRTARPLPASWMWRIERLHGQLGVRVRVLVRETAHIAAPVMVGWLKPTILLPLGICARLPVAQVELILAHELAHVRRLDAWANAVQLAVETVLFYHPGVHWVGRRIREDRELACDALVARSGMDRLVLARALLALAEERRREVSGLALGATGGVLLGRVEQLLQVAPSERPRWEGLLPAAVLALGMVVLALPLARQWSEAPLAEQLLPPALSLPSLVRIAPVIDLVVRDIRMPSAAQGLPELLQESIVEPLPIEPGTQLDSQESTPIAGEALRAAPPVELSILPPDFAAPAAAAPGAGAAPPILETVAAEPLRVLQREAPEYPRLARLRGIEGSVEVSFRIDERGRPADVRIESSGQAMFASAALAALARWRFPESAAGEQRHLQRFDFSLKGEPTQVDAAIAAATAASTADGCQAPTGSRICRRMP